MKLLFVFIFCFLTPFISAGSGYSSDSGSTQEYNCVCVDVMLCDYRYTSTIRPRSLRQECNIGNQVCCRPEHITQFPNQNLPSPSDYNPNTDQCGRRNPIPNNYGRLVTPNTLVALGQAPWQVAILRNSSVGNFLISSGVLLNQNAILTTAHTLNNLYPEQIIARLGENNFQADPSRKYPALNARISSITINPDFNRNNLANDVAVLCLRSPVTLSATINPVCLPDPSDFIGDSASVVVSGWGKNSFNGNYSTILRQSYQNLLPIDICSDNLRSRVNDPNYILDDTFTCASGPQGRDATCTGDAGSPLTATNRNGQQVLVGISSWGINCGEPNVPGVYSNVRQPAIYEWIKSTVQACDTSSTPSSSYPSSNNYNNDYTVVTYNSNNYDSNQNYNGQSNDYNSMNNNNNYNNNNNNYNPSSDYQNYNGQSNDYNSMNNNNYNPSQNYNQNYNGQSNDYNLLNNNYNPSSDYYSNSIEYNGRSLNSPTETAKSAVESLESPETEAVSA